MYVCVLYGKDKVTIFSSLEESLHSLTCEPELDFISSLGLFKQLYTFCFICMYLLPRNISMSDILYSTLLYFSLFLQAFIRRKIQLTLYSLNCDAGAAIPDCYFKLHGSVGLVAFPCKRAL